jgi:hypothetical protein
MLHNATGWESNQATLRFSTSPRETTLRRL